MSEEDDKGYYLVYKSTKDFVIGKLIKKVDTYPQALEVVSGRFKEIYY